MKSSRRKYIYRIRKHMDSTLGKIYNNRRNRRRIWKTLVYY